MKIDKIPVAPGAYSVTWDTSSLEILQDFRNVDHTFLINFLKYIGDQLGIIYVQHSIYDYQLIIERNKPLTSGTSEWHNDTDDRDDFDIIFMIYNVDPMLDETTGMRVGFRTINDNNETFLNIANGTTYLARHDQKRFQHKIENKCGNIISRACLSVNYRGFERLVNTQELTVE